MPERDFTGYGKSLPTGKWPGQARLAISIVVNYEEGAEWAIGNGDQDQEGLTEWGRYDVPPGARDLAMESMFEYGARVGIWRVLDVLAQADVKSTFFACAQAFEKNPDVAAAAVSSGHEICGHGYRWENPLGLSRKEERCKIELAIESFRRVCGQRPVGWYCPYCASTNTRELLVEEGGFIYDSDAYNDDVPYFVNVGNKKHLVVPYVPDANDIRLWLVGGLFTSEDFYTYLKDTFDTLYAEAGEHPKMMSVGLHPRVIGRPGRIVGLKRFIDYAQSLPEVWFATRAEIARFWIANQK